MSYGVTPCRITTRDVDPNISTYIIGIAMLHAFCTLLWAGNSLPLHLRIAVDKETPVTISLLNGLLL